MKYILIIAFALSGPSTNAQKKSSRNTYNTRIDTAARVVINRGATTIFRADTVIINQSIRTKLYYLGAFSTRDTTTGTYLTLYRFRPEYNSGSFPADIFIKFNKPFVPLTRTEPFYVDGSAGGGIASFSIGCSPDFTALRARGYMTGSDDIVIHVKSKELLFAEIFGVDGRGE